MEDSITTIVLPPAPSQGHATTVDKSRWDPTSLHCTAHRLRRTKILVSSLCSGGGHCAAYLRTGVGVL